MRDYNSLVNEKASRNYNLMLRARDKNTTSPLFTQPKPNMNRELVKVLDSLSNPVARLGVGTENIINAAEYHNENITQNYALLNSLYRDNWVIQNIIAAVPNDITKKWFNIKCNLPPSELDKVDKVYRRTKLIKSINEGMRWGRLYGGAIGIIMIKGQTNNLEEPLDYDLIAPDSFLGIFILDRWQGAYPCLDAVTNPEDNDFGLPEYYEITDSSLNIYARVHHSKVIRFIGRDLPQIEKIRELYWGVSEVESIYRELIRRDTTAENIASLIFKANLSVLTIKDLDQMFALNSLQAQERFWNIIQNISTVESSMGIKLVNEGDRAEYLNYTFNGIKEVYETMMMDLAGASRIPVTKLFGRSPAGMNSTGESDLQNYYDYIDEVREGQFRDIVMKILPILALSCWGKIPNDLDFEFEEMKTLDDSEKAQLAQQLSGTIIEAFNSNLITQDIAQKELKSLSEKIGIFTNITDDLIEQSKGNFINDLQQTDDPMAGLMSGSEGGEENPFAAMMGGTPQGGMPAQPNTEDSLIDNEKDKDKDEITLYLEDIKRRLLNEQPQPQYNNSLGWEGGTVNIDNKDSLLKEYDRIEKLNKKISKEYDEATNIMYGYNTDDIPLNMVNEYNKLKNKYTNSCNDLERIKQELIKAGYNIDLLKHTGDFDKELGNIREELGKINSVIGLINEKQSSAAGLESNKINIPNIPLKLNDTAPISRYKLLQIIETLLVLNDKINQHKKHNEDLGLEQYGNSKFSDEYLIKEQIELYNSSINKELERLNEPYNIETKDGGAGSGNFGHKGRPGKVGGSGKGNQISENQISENQKEPILSNKKAKEPIKENSNNYLINKCSKEQLNSAIKKTSDYFFFEGKLPKDIKEDSYFKNACEFGSFSEKMAVVILGIMKNSKKWQALPEEDKSKYKPLIETLNKNIEKELKKGYKPTSKLKEKYKYPHEVVSALMPAQPRQKIDIDKVSNILNNDNNKDSLIEAIKLNNSNESIWYNGSYEEIGKKFLKEQDLYEEEVDYDEEDDYEKYYEDWEEDDEGFEDYDDYYEFRKNTDPTAKKELIKKSYTNKNILSYKKAMDGYVLANKALPKSIENSILSIMPYMPTYKALYRAEYMDKDILLNLKQGEPLPMYNKQKGKSALSSFASDPENIAYFNEFEDDEESEKGAKVMIIYEGAQGYDMASSSPAGILESEFLCDNRDIIFDRLERYDENRYFIYAKKGGK